MTLTKPAGHEDVPELLPCPFCGGEAVLHEAEYDIVGPCVECCNPACMVAQNSGQHISNADAIAAWNRRAKAPAEATELAPDVKGLVEGLTGYAGEGAEDENTMIGMFARGVRWAKRELLSRASRLSAPPAEAKPVAWSVKPLEWTDEPGRDAEFPGWVVETPFGKDYRFFKAWWRKENVWGYVGEGGFYRTPEEAKAAAQADYEQRILSALVHPDPRAKAAEAVPEGTHDYRALLTNALTAVRALDDYTAINEVEWDASGENEVPPLATFWRVKSGQALKALDELRPSMLGAANGMAP